MQFNGVNSQLLTYIVAFNPKNSFEAFKYESLIELVSHNLMISIQHNLRILIEGLIFWAFLAAVPQMTVSRPFILIGRLR